VSAVRSRLALMICDIRLGGTSIWRANSVAVMPMTSSSSARNSPGCIASLVMLVTYSLISCVRFSLPSILLALVIIYNFDIISLVVPTKTDSPLLINTNTKLALSAA